MDERSLQEELAGAAQGRQFSNNWRLDKTVPIALIVVILGASATGATWVANVSMRVSALEEYRRDNAATIALAIEKLNQSREDTNNRLTHLEDRAEAILEIIRRIDAQRLGESVGAPPAIPRGR